MNLYTHTAKMADLLLPQKPRMVRGLPSVAPARRDVAMQSRSLGATKTQLGGVHPNFVPVGGQPSMKLVELAGGGVAVEITRFSAHAEMLSDNDLRPILSVGKKMQRDAESMSQGPLSTRDLRRMGHPYGRGRRQGLGRLQGARAGVSNLAIANKQSGEFASSWFTDIRRGKGGVTLRLGNSSSVAGYLAFGTSKMKAHGPFTTAAGRELYALNAEWRRLAIVAHQRERMVAAASRGMNG